MNVNSTLIQLTFSSMKLLISTTNWEILHVHLIQPYYFGIKEYVISYDKLFWITFVVKHSTKLKIVTLIICLNMTYRNIGVNNGMLELAQSVDFNCTNLKKLTWYAKYRNIGQLCTISLNISNTNYSIFFIWMKHNGTFRQKWLDK